MDKKKNDLKSLVFPRNKIFKFEIKQIFNESFQLKCESERINFLKQILNKIHQCWEEEIKKAKNEKRPFHISCLEYNVRHKKKLPKLIDKPELHPVYKQIQEEIKFLRPSLRIKSLSKDIELSDVDDFVLYGMGDYLKYIEFIKSLSIERRMVYLKWSIEEIEKIVDNGKTIDKEYFLDLYDYIHKVNDLKECIRNNKDTKYQAKEKIKWKGTESQIIALFELLQDKGLIEGFIKDKTKEHQWKLIANHFKNRLNKPFDAKQMGSVFQREDIKHAKKVIIEKIST